MPNWNSDDGVLTPAKESAVMHSKGTEANPNGEPLVDSKGNIMVYNGPDRAAVQVLKEAGVDHMGVNFREDNELIDRAADRRKTVDEFCKTNIHTDEKRAADYKVKAARINSHSAVKRGTATKVKSGGIKMKGGFGTEDSAMTDALKSAPTH